jgi:hypothetical protein
VTARRLVPNPDVVVHEEGGEAFLLHVATGRYFALNPSGVVVWRALVDGRSPEDALAATYPDQPRERLRSDLETLVAALLEADLVRPS